MVETPQSFVVSTECRKAAEQHGYRRQLDEIGGWTAFQSTTAKGTIWLAAEGEHGPWYMALEHSGVISELNLEAADILGPGTVRHIFSDLDSLYAALRRQYELAVSLPSAPLNEFFERTHELPRTTEAERLIIQRVGQDIFRDRLLKYWQGRCPLTGITDAALLRASHIKPWSACVTDDERLDVHNGLLLSALWDVAFDAGLVTFNNDGQPKLSGELSNNARRLLHYQNSLNLSQNHIIFLE